MPDSNKYIDVLPTFNNCFFHCLSLHYLSKGIPLPDDLFTPHGLDTQYVRAIKKVIQTAEDLELFKQVTDSSYLVEKTLVLGVLFRSYFSNFLSDNWELGVKLFDSKDENLPQGMQELIFMKLVEGRLELGLEAFLQNVQEQAPSIYLANKDFFKQVKEPELYWLEEGYLNFCRYIGTNIKLSAFEADLFLTSKLNIPFAAYNDDKKSNEKLLITSNSEQPDFQFLLDAKDKHYNFIETQPSQVLEEYKTRFEGYKLEREKILAMAANSHTKLAEAQNSPFLLVAATFPASEEGFKYPMQLLVNRLNYLSEKSKAKKLEIIAPEEIAEIVITEQTAQPEMEDQSIKITEQDEPVPEPSAFMQSDNDQDFIILSEPTPSTLKKESTPIPRNVPRKRPLPKAKEKVHSCANISMMVLGGFIAAAGIAAVALAFTVLNAATLGIAGIATAVAAVPLFFSGVGLFATGIYKNRQPGDEQPLDASNPILR
ncbi:MAG: hypothetical protein WC785_10670 [Tatlockia sp.]|jgi:hypothetical protein